MNIPSAPIEVNIIITCFDKEEYREGLMQCINEYKFITPNICLCYNGEMDVFPCDLKMENQGHQLGDISMTLAGYKYFKGNGVNRFLKIGIDSWILDDKVIYEIFRSLESSQSSYAGNYWFAENTPSLATDIIFADTTYGNIFEAFEWDGVYFETSLFNTVVKNNLKISFITERVPIDPLNRFKCDKLNWVMEHDLKKNFESYWKYKNYLNKK